MKGVEKLEGGVLIFGKNSMNVFPVWKGGKKRNKCILCGILKKKSKKKLLCGKKGIKGNPRQKIHTKLYIGPKTNSHSTIF